MTKNSKTDSDLDLNDKPVSLKSVLENDLKKLNAVYVEDHLKIDKSIHTIRKSLKSISAILLLCEIHFDKVQYLTWQSSIKSLSKKYGEGREHCVYLQTFSQIEQKLKSYDNSNLNKLRYNLELQYNLIVNDIKNKDETDHSGKESITKLTEELSTLDFNFEHKSLRRRLIISCQKSRRLFNSSVNFRIDFFPCCIVSFEFLISFTIKLYCNSRLYLNSYRLLLSKLFSFSSI